MEPPHPETFFDWARCRWGGALRARQRLKAAVLVASGLRTFQLRDE